VLAHPYKAKTINPADPIRRNALPDSIGKLSLRLRQREILRAGVMAIPRSQTPCYEERCEGFLAFTLLGRGTGKPRAIATAGDENEV